MRSRNKATLCIGAFCPDFDRVLSIQIQYNPVSANPQSFTYDVRITRAVIIRLAGYSVLLLWGAFQVFDMAVGWMSPSLHLSTVVFTLLVYAATLALHEGIHGITMRCFGARPEYGVALLRRILPVAYATAPGHRFTLKEMIAVALSPLVVLSIASIGFGIAVPSLGYYVFVIFAGNLTGAVGDLWMTTVIWRFHRCREVFVLDERTGLRIESNDPAASTVAREIESSGTRLTRFMVASFAVLMLITWVGLPVADMLTPTGMDPIRAGPAWFPLLEFSQTDGGLSIYFRHIVVASMVLALPTLLIRRRKRRSALPANPDHTDIPGVPALL